MVLRFVYYSIKSGKLQPLREKNYGKLAGAVGSAAKKKRGDRAGAVGSAIVNFFKKTYCKKSFYLL